MNEMITSAHSSPCTASKLFVFDQIKATKQYISVTESVKEALNVETECEKFPCLISRHFLCDEWPA